MKLSSPQIQVLAEKILHHWKKQNIAVFKEDEKKVLARAVEIIQQEYDRESALDREVHAMLDKLEESNAGEFERYKMFPILKKKLAKDKKVIL
jgi:hypothetical protein